MSILEGLRAAREAYYETTGKPLLEVHLPPKEYQVLCTEAIPGAGFRFVIPMLGILPELLIIDGECEVRPR